MMKALSVFSLVSLLAFPAMAYDEADLTRLKETGHCASCDLSGAPMAALFLPGADFTGSDLTDADLSQTELSGAGFNNANLSGVNLSDANAAYADFTAADLRHADLSRANFYSADMREAVLSHANLDGANFTRAHRAGITAVGAFVCKTTMPDGHVEHRDC